MISVVVVLMDQCSGQDKYDAILSTAVKFTEPPSGPLFMLSTVTEGYNLCVRACVRVCVCVCVCVRSCASVLCACASVCILLYDDSQLM